MSIRDLVIESLTLGNLLANASFTTAKEIVKRKSLVPIKEAAQGFIRGFQNK